MPKDTIPTLRRIAMESSSAAGGPNLPLSLLSFSKPSMALRTLEQLSRGIESEREDQHESTRFNLVDVEIEMLVQIYVATAFNSVGVYHDIDPSTLDPFDFEKARSLAAG